ncbi:MULTISPECIES: class I SAM-dependent methyltransferase [unclassified Methanoregula]|uniref:class I SAM-dependent methyltransferase n=1 Tax=unclassified Methanoregula TaxID=2649730 RepID=UPI0009CDA164|nr:MULTISPECIES: class I SAM-dependent methyltransferase [unclassified Methanoregula]OPX61828.1 MAG: Ribosomal RNA small subunit methyltransferase G [Methanoregula sp. PtaB.Bin085]OPY35074.1 MAG: Ribosomal RNA small subunit methyltransferase G [Methanoregula sp. PtaU1.Bin006]
MDMTVSIDWEIVWKESVEETGRVSTTGYWNSRADDYSRMVNTSNFDHGRKILDLFLVLGIVRSDWDVLDIASGPGALTLPFAGCVKSVSAVEPAAQMAVSLMENARKSGLSNISIIPKTWQEFPVLDYEKRFDMVTCCHALWQFPDLLNQVRRMETVSRGYCCLAHGIDTSERILKERLGVPVDGRDQFITLFNFLNNAGIYPNVNIVEYSLMWPVEAAIASKERFVEKYRPLTDTDREIIHEYIARHTADGIYRIPGSLGVFWWEAE